MIIQSTSSFFLNLIHRQVDSIASWQFWLLDYPLPLARVIQQIHHKFNKYNNYPLSWSDNHSDSDDNYN